MDSAQSVKKVTMKRYQKVKRSLLDRHRRSTQNKQIVHELQQLIEEEEASVQVNPGSRDKLLQRNKNFRIGFINAVNEVSRLLASTPGVDVEMGKAIMTHLGLVYNRLMQQPEMLDMREDIARDFASPPVSPASSGYYSDGENSRGHSSNVWRPW